MSDYHRSKLVRARKDYECDACIWYKERMITYGGFDISPLTYAEKRQMAKAKQDNWMVKKGQMYLRREGKYDGMWYSVACRPEIDDICYKYDIYDPWG